MELTNSHCVPYQHLFFPCTLQGKQGRQGPRGGSLAGVRGADLQGYQRGQGKQETHENLGNLLSALAHFLGMFSLFVCFPETSVLRIQDFP